MAEQVQGAAWGPGGLAGLAEPFGKSLRVNRAAELVGNDEILVSVGMAGNGPLGARNR